MTVPATLSDALAVIAERDKTIAELRAELRIAIGGCDANDGYNHSPMSLPNDPRYIFCQTCGETMTKAEAKRHSSAAAVRSSHSAALSQIEAPKGGE